MQYATNSAEVLRTESEETGRIFYTVIQLCQSFIGQLSLTGYFAQTVKQMATQEPDNKRPVP